MSRGWLDEETLAEAISFQADLPRGMIDEKQLLLDATRLPIPLLEHHRVLLQGEDSAGRAILLIAGPLTEPALADLRARLGKPLAQHVVRERDIAGGLQLLRERLGSPARAPAETPATPLLGELMIEAGFVQRDRFEAALQDYRPGEDGRIGDYMVAREVISPQALSRALDMQRELRGAAGVMA